MRRFLLMMLMVEILFNLKGQVINVPRGTLLIGYDPKEDKYCTQNDDCITGQSCIEGKCENFIVDN